VPIKATAGGATAQVVTQGRTTQLSVPGCGPLLVNAGQRGYFRTMYAPAEAQALVALMPKLAPVDQYGLMADQMTLSTAGYQPMAVGLSFLSAIPADASAKVAQRAVNRWDDLYDLMDGNPAAQAAIAARVTREFGPRLQQLGFAPKAGEPAVDALLRPTLIATLGKYHDPAVLAEASRLFGAWQRDPDAIPGSLKSTWLGVIARNADAATWEAIHEQAKEVRGTAQGTTLYQLLGRAQDETLARRTLDLALTAEPGKTVSAGMITSVAVVHPELAVQFVLRHLDQVNRLIDTSGRSSFMQRLAQNSRDASLIPVLDAYAKANLAPPDRAPVQRTIDRIRSESEQLARIQSETSEWLQANQR
jgi:aminopeptidase N